MCLTIYVAADEPLPEIPWDKKNRAFNVQSVADKDRVRRQFSKPYIYYVGSDEGCGCGFLPEDWKDPTGADALRNMANRERLHDYLVSAVQRGPVELFAVWTGEESMPPEERAEVTPAHFMSTWHDFGERQFFVVKKA